MHNHNFVEIGGMKACLCYCADCWDKEYEECVCSECQWKDRMKKTKVVK